MKNKLRKKEGITLIALVITIIVLLILAGVSISMISSQDGILSKATGAKETQKNATELERVKLAVQAALVDGEGTVDLSKAATGKDPVGLEKALKDEFGTGENSPYTTYKEGIVKLSNGKEYSVTSNGKIEKIIKLEEVNLKIGDSFKLLKSTATTETEEDKYEYKVIGMDIENSGNVLLAMDPVGNKALSGVADWLNCVSELKTACAPYSVKIGTTTFEARSMNESDMLMLSGYTPSGENYGKKLNELSCWNDIKAKGTYTPDGTNTEKRLGEYIYNFYSFNAADVEDETARNLLFGSESEWHYWLASRSISAGSDYAGFGVFAMVWGMVGASDMCTSNNGDNGGVTICVRPIVSVPADMLE